MNTNNIINLLRVYRISNGKNIIVSLSIAFVFSIFFCGSGDLVSMVYFIGLIAASLRIFGILERPSTSIHYLSLPASNCEKLFVNFLLVNVIYVVGYYFVMSLGVLVGQISWMLIQNDFDPSQLSWYSVYFDGDLLSDFCVLYASIAIAFLFSVVFKGRMGRSVLLFCVIVLCFAILVGITISLNIKSILPAGYGFGDFDWTVGPDFPALNENVIEIVVALVTMSYCYVLSFLRLREMEA